MYKDYQRRLARLTDPALRRLLSGNLIGLEKESLRVNSNGRIAQTAHPRDLGSALTHPYITTDYSEALTEFITPACPSAQAALAYLQDIQTYTYRHLDDELLWGNSMPCVVAGEDSVPVAQYGRSNRGMMKTIYRRGLGHRYGRVMQVIAGVHFNFSLNRDFWPAYQRLEGDSRPLPTFISESYLGMIRNLQRFGWLAPYLFGASPAVCKSFLHGQSTPMESFDDYSYYYPYATSLRMSDIGYQNNKEFEKGFKASYDNLAAYIDSLTDAISTPCPQYEKIGVVVDGEYRQLNANILQIENEYYSTIRPKQLLSGMEKPTLALKKRGVLYVELRSLDINPFNPLGIETQQLEFLEIFLLFCLLHESPPLTREEQREIDANQLAAANRGRDPELHLQRRGAAIPLRQWAQELCEMMGLLCELLDAVHGDQRYGATLQLQQKLIADPTLTPSARVLDEMRSKKESFFEFALRQSRQHQDYFKQLPLAAERSAEFQAMAQQSLREQAAIEAADDLSFAEYLQRYFAQQ